LPEGIDEEEADEESMLAVSPVPRW